MLKNLSIDYTKRPWRTPSPSTNSIKSPRYVRAGLFNKIASKNSKNEISNDLRSKPMLHNFKNQLVQMKQQANKAWNPDSIEQTQQSDKPQQNLTPNQLQSYGAYFPNIGPSSRSTITSTKAPYPTPNISNTPKNVSITNIVEQNVSTCSSIQNDTRIPSLMKSRHKYDDVVKKCMNQAAEIKVLYQELKEKYEKLGVYCQGVQGELMECKKQIEVLKGKYQDKKNKQKILTEQISKLKQQLDKNNQQLKSLTTQSTRLKHQLSLCPQPQKHSAPSPASPPTPTPIPTPICQYCKSRDKMIITLNNSLEYKMHEVGKKDTLISNLITDIQKIDNQLKMYEKPKTFLKKVNCNVDEVNQLIIVAKVKELNVKFKNIMG